MSELLHDLKRVRSSWHEAFHSKDLELLDYLETDWFLSTNGQKVIYKKHQLRKLGARDIRADNYRTGQRQERDVQI